MDDDTVRPGDRCRTCKSFSAPNTRMAKKGFCLKNKKGVTVNDVCGHYRPDVKVEYKQECKPSDNIIGAAPRSRFSN